MITRPSMLAYALALLAPFACGGGGGGDEGGSSGSATDVSSSFGTHSASDPSAVSMTFTNSSDPSDPSDPTDVSISTDATASTTDDPSTGVDVTGGTAETSGGDSSGGSATDPTTDTDTGTPGGACCEVQAEGGCGDADIEACVCAREPFCCDVAWDAVCTVQTVLLDCASCAGIGGAGDCCAAHGNPGCDDDVVEQCVCNEDFVCCLEPWDEICVDIAMTSCAAC